jgi:hypothetical protein
MQSLWFVVPAHGRLELARICLRQLRRTCDALEQEGVEATAVVIADDDNLDTAHELGFGIVRRDNRFLSRKFNDGIQLAMDPTYNKCPADYVVPCGTDDWVDWRLFADLPPSRIMVGFRSVSFVRPDGRDLQAVHLPYEGGAGVRIWPRHAMAKLNYRPADEDRTRGCDTSILINVQREYPWLNVQHRESDARQIVDWKSASNVNSYETVVARWRGVSLGDPFVELADLYPAEALDEMRAYHGALVAA